MTKKKHEYFTAVAMAVQRSGYELATKKNAVMVNYVTLQSTSFLSRHS
jgi:hypothetical protein